MEIQATAPNPRLLLARLERRERQRSRPRGGFSCQLSDALLGVLADDVDGDPGGRVGRPTRFVEEDSLPAGGRGVIPGRTADPRRDVRRELRRKETATSGDIALVAEDAKDQRAAAGEAAASASQPSSTTGWGTAHDVRRAAEAKSASSPLHPFPTAYVITEPRVAYRFNLGD